MVDVDARLAKAAKRDMSAANYLPEETGITSLRAAAERCRGCDLYKDATQTVFGEGATHAALMFVGEQPGDVEDQKGRPFVGPAGKLLRTALAQAGISEDETYITNAVKHFKFVLRGKRRIHAKPKVTEVRACLPWLEAEIDAVEPHVIVALGATAAQSLLGSSFRLTEHRQSFMPSKYKARVIATVHPSSILRADEATRDAEFAGFVEDLAYIARALV